MATEVRPDHYAPRRYRVRHTTIYTYDDDVEACYERGFLRPLETWSQQVVTNEVAVSPEPQVISQHVDHFGNHSFYVEIRDPHRELVVSKTAFVDVAWPRPVLESLNAFTVAEAVARVEAEADAVVHAEFLLPSDLVDLGPEVLAYARQILWADRPLGDALVGLYSTIYRDFKYELGATSVRTTLPELLELRRGVCQDFAHLAVGCLRSIGLPARYVSGYVETSPPPGQPKLRGVGRLARLDLGAGARRRVDRPRPHERPLRRLALHRHRVGPRLSRRVTAEGRDLHRVEEVEARGEGRRLPGERRRHADLTHGRLVERRGSAN